MFKIQTTVFPRSSFKARCTDPIANVSSASKSNRDNPSSIKQILNLFQEQILAKQHSNDMTSEEMENFQKQMKEFIDGIQDYATKSSSSEDYLANTSHNQSSSTSNNKVEKLFKYDNFHERFGKFVTRMLELKDEDTSIKNVSNWLDFALGICHSTSSCKENYQNISARPQTPVFVLSRICRKSNKHAHKNLM